MLKIEKKVPAIAPLAAPPDFDLELVMDRVADEYPELTQKELEQAQEEYTNFLRLAATYPTISVSPSKLADKVWHAHILFTAMYAADCETYLGYFLHHSPYHKHTGEDQKRHTAKTTQKLYKEHFGVSLKGQGDCYWGCSDSCMCGNTKGERPKPSPRGPSGPTPNISNETH